MARPKTVKRGRKLNLYVPLAAKQMLFLRATELGKSISAVVTDLVLADDASRKRQAEFAAKNPVLPGLAEGRKVA